MQEPKRKHREEVGEESPTSKPDTQGDDGKQEFPVHTSRDQFGNESYPLKTSPFAAAGNNALQPTQVIQPIQVIQMIQT